MGFQCHDWTVISEKEVVRKRKRLIRCRCKCGHESLILAYRLRPHSQDGATSCPACAMATRKAIYTHTLTREYLVQQYIDAHRTINDIARETGFDQLTVRRRLCAYGIPLRKRSDAESYQLTGRVFGLLSVGAMLRKRQRSGAIIYYRCVCTCGAVREVRAAHLIAGASKACKRCASGHSASSPHWTGCGEITGYYWGRVCRGAKQRWLVVEITIEQAWQVFLRQKRRCALTDLPERVNDFETTAERI